MSMARSTAFTLVGSVSQLLLALASLAAATQAVLLRLG